MLPPPELRHSGRDMAAAGSTGIERAKSLGYLMGAGVLLAGSMGLFASGLAAAIGTAAAVACLGGYCYARVAEQVAEVNQCYAVERAWHAQNAEAPVEIEPEIDTSLPEKSFVASLDRTRMAGRSR